MFILSKDDIQNFQLECAPHLTLLAEGNQKYLGVIGRGRGEKEVLGLLIIDILNEDTIQSFCENYNETCGFVINPTEVYKEKREALDTVTVENTFNLIGLTANVTMEETVHEVINAIRLVGEWETKYDKTQDGLLVTFLSLKGVAASIQFNLDEEIMNQFSVIERIQ
jgi:hypothetical protein